MTELVYTHTGCVVFVVGERKMKQTTSDRQRKAHSPGQKGKFKKKDEWRDALWYENKCKEGLMLMFIV